MTEKGLFFFWGWGVGKLLKDYRYSKNKNPAVFEIATTGTVGRSYSLSVQKESTETGDTTVSK